MSTKAWFSILSLQAVSHQRSAFSFWALTLTDDC